MTTFLDGPAVGQCLSLRRAPLLLRVVHYTGGNRCRTVWDALDQVEDQPRRDEEVFLYILVEEPTWIHFLIRGKGKKDGGFYENGNYKLLDPQPPEWVMFLNEDWDRWCNENGPKLAPAWWAERLAKKARGVK